MKVLSGIGGKFSFFVFLKKKGMKRRKEKGYFVVTLVMLTLDWIYSNVAFTIIGNSF